jgi:lipopolysaccharide/colanic/teichoic acid biosynthesis glycosyltransferase
VEGELSPKSLPATFDPVLGQSAHFRVSEDTDALEQQKPGRKPATTSRYSSIRLVRQRVSAWSRSGAKRLFDVACIAAIAPFWIPLSLLLGLAVRLTSPGPVLFLQKRMGRGGCMFVIAKFRTVEHCEIKAYRAVTTSDSQRFTPFGHFLRRWNLDKLPQLWNVLGGDMSLVGPRPGLPEHQMGRLQCRPGITGAATLAFAREESFLARLPKRDLDAYERERILLAKHRIDLEYMAHATFFSDFKLLVDTIFRRRDISLIEGLMSETISVETPQTAQPTVTTHTHISVIPVDADLTPEQQFTEA